MIIWPFGDSDSILNALPVLPKSPSKLTPRMMTTNVRAEQPEILRCGATQQQKHNSATNVWTQINKVLAALQKANTPAPTSTGGLTAADKELIKSIKFKSKQSDSVVAAKPVVMVVMKRKVDAMAPSSSIVGPSGTANNSEEMSKKSNTSSLSTGQASAATVPAPAPAAPAAAAVNSMLADYGEDSD